MPIRCIELTQSRHVNDGVPGDYAQNTYRISNTSLDHNVFATASTIGILYFRRMKRYLLILFCLALLVPAFGQMGRRKKPKSTFKEHVWIGANLTDFGFGSRSFSMGLTPMAGYYMTNSISLGVMLRMAYRYENVAAQPPKIKFETFDIGPAAFIRFELGSLMPESLNTSFLGGLFLQAEYEYAFEQVPLVDQNGFWIIEDNKVQKENAQRGYAYLGAGFCSGEGVQFCVSIHYNVLDDIYSVRNLWDYRFGFKWDLVPPGSRTTDSKRKR